MEVSGCKDNLWGRIGLNMIYDQCSVARVARRSARAPFRDAQCLQDRVRADSSDLIESALRSNRVIVLNSIAPCLPVRRAGYVDSVEAVPASNVHKQWH